MWKSAACFVAVLILNLASSSLAVAQAKESWTIGDYTVDLTRIDGDDGHKAELTVFRGGKILHAMSDQALAVNPPSFFADPGSGAANDQRPYKIGEDVLGLGAPSLVIQSFSGGAHCCFALTVLIPGAEFRALPILDLFNSDEVSIRKVVARAALVMSFRDFTYDYWRASFATSSAPPVTLSFDGKSGRYDADAELMRAPLPAPSDLEAWRAKAWAAHQQELDRKSSEVPYELTEPVLDLIYSGHLTEARAFLDGAWAGTRESREDYWSDLTTCELRLSQFWPTVARMNGLPAEKPVGKCPRS